jgi:saccharopine dehydrogenase-like NADP-dependent oxidoreductase
MVTRPLVRYLLSSPGFEVTVATRTVHKAERMLEGHPSGRAVSLDVQDDAALTSLIGECDLAVSLLPWTLHMRVARACLEAGAHLVTTSYVREEMRALDAAVKNRGLVFINECGLDPGIDHMSAMRIIDGIGARGGRVVEFRSCCGGLPAPEDDDNPWGYKFSWSPRGVVLAGLSPGRYLLDGRQVDVPARDLFTDVTSTEIPEVGPLEYYPNRDSLGYRELYGLRDARTIFRGTFRYPGHCRTWKALVDLGWLDLEERDVAGKTYGELQAELIGGRAEGVHEQAAARLGMEPDEDPVRRMEWLGLFGPTPIPVPGPISPLDVLADRLEHMLPYEKGERDMIVLQHRFLAEYDDGRTERITSTLVDTGVFGSDTEDTAMARTVSLPAAMAARSILEGAISTVGVHIPHIRGLYEPILDELAHKGIRFEEIVEPT